MTQDASNFYRPIRKNPGTIIDYKNGSRVLPMDDEPSLAMRVAMLEEEVEKLKAQASKGSPSRFIPPTVEEVAEYCRRRPNNVDPEKFHSYYTSKGWRVGGSPMKDWQAAVRTWERNTWSK